MRIAKVRPYRMRRRAENVDETRLRITEAAVRLHTTVGPAATTIAGVAAEAGVTRPTVYRHFPDLDTLFVACSGHWATRHPGPDPDAWRTIAGLEERAHVALSELYRWYRAVGDELYPIHRDVEALPASAQAALRADNARLAEAIVNGGAGQGRAGRRLRAAAGHAVDLLTWRSLTLNNGLDDADAVELAVGLLRGAATPSR